VVDALASVAALQDDVPYDVLVLDDASTDDSLEMAADFLDRHPSLPAQLLSHDVNRGLARSRNALLERARGPLVFILDADNGLYPSALTRLTAALDDDEDAAFAYPIIAAIYHGRPVDLIGATPWSPEQLRNGNYIDAMTLLRRDRILALGGYTTDPRLTGWEDFYLWCACAEAGERGLLVPQILAWYRRTDHSMISEMRGNTERAWSLVRERFASVLTPQSTASG
jgi:glycosyltransferase involved in cell wall biosynthesis